MLDSDLPVSERIVAGIDRARRNIAADGAVFSGSQRVEIAHTARTAATRKGPGAAQSAAARMATHAHALATADVTAFDDPASYVETLGVVARTMAIDTTARGVGAGVVPIPAPTTTESRGSIDPAARQRSALVPTVGAAGPTTALSLVPSEDAAQEDLHGALYLSYAEMGDLRIHKGLPRWQLELVAARTSLINHCFF